MLPEVGSWSKRKYHFLSRFLEIFSTGMKNQWPQRHYIDLFAGSGFARIRGTQEVVATSAIIAANVKDQFTRLHLCEADSAKSAALENRLSPRGGTFEIHRGDANTLIYDVLSKIPGRGALSTCFVDPYGLHFTFETASVIASLPCDLIVLLPDSMDVTRNWQQYYDQDPNSNLDAFMGEPGWREKFREPGNSDVATRFRERYQSRLRTLQYEHFDSVPVANDQGVRIYSLMFASRHKLGLKFWTAAKSVDEGGQREFEFS